jgi:HlyD family secretion protein
VGAIDATELMLRRDQLAAQRAAAASRVNEVARQIEALEAQRLAAVSQQDAAAAEGAALGVQRDLARRAYERTDRLFEQEAASAQQLEQAEREYRVLEERIKAQAHQVAAQGHQVDALARQVAAARALVDTTAQQVAAIEAELAQVEERIRKSQVRNPASGTVLATYARAGEVVQTGQPLYRVADLGTVEVRAYVAQPQLAHVSLGMPAQVSVDIGDGERRTLAGTVSWVSAESEFTPTPIQTREERAELVYAVKIRVPNDEGLLKIGMPVDVRFGESGQMP